MQTIDHVWARNVTLFVDMSVRNIETEVSKYGLCRPGFFKVDNFSHYFINNEVVGWYGFTTGLVYGMYKHDSFVGQLDAFRAEEEKRREHIIKQQLDAKDQTIAHLEQKIESM